MTPENNFPGLVTDPEAILTSVIPLENFLGLRTASASKSGNPVTPDCLTVLIWSVVFWVNSLTVNAVSIPLIISFSPVAKVPEVWLRFNDDAEAPRTTKPLAPLLFPFIKEEVGISVAVTLLLKTTFV